METSFFNYKVRTLGGKPLALKEYEGRVVLAVNVASKCGYTPQYKELQALYEKYKDRGFVVLGFPSNDFGAQEPGTAQEIAKFCEINYGVTFPLFSKNPVTGDNKQPVYQFLTAKASEPGEVSWNFEKFLVDKSGNVVGRYKSAVKPLSEQITKDIEKHL